MMNKLNNHTVQESTPFVSVVVPCRNEEEYIEGLLDNLSHQYDSKRYEIVIADGMSNDNTRKKILDFIVRNPDLQIRLLDNPKRYIPAGLNAAINESEGDIIVRMDAHSFPSRAYVRHCVEILSTTNFDVVGAPCQMQPGSDTPVAQAIAWGVAHPFGIGDAQYRIQPERGQTVDTVPFGVFHKSLWQSVGGFDESLLTNEDYDFFYRIRQRGGKIYLDPKVHCTYFARPTLGDLAKQYFRYGTWKAQAVKQRPRSLAWRQTVPPTFVAALVLLSTIGTIWPVAWATLFLMLAVYLTLSTIFAIRLSLKHDDFKTLPFIPLVFFTIHSTWGFGFLLGLLRSLRESK